MKLKVIEIPDNADYITAHEQINAGGSFLLQKYNVADLPDAPAVVENAPEKRVIELSADVIDELEKNKIYSLFGFMEIAADNGIIKRIITNSPVAYSASEVESLIGDWYLGHVEFVPKKEPVFIVEIPIGSWYVHMRAYFNKTDGGLPNFVAQEYRALRMTETEADELVAGLLALKPRKVKVEE